MEKSKKNDPNHKSSLKKSNYYPILWQIQNEMKSETLKHICLFFLLESIIVYFGYYYICNNDNRWFFFFVHLPSCFWPNWVVEWELGGRKMDGLRGERKKRFFQREKPIVLHQYFFNNYFLCQSFFNIIWVGKFF